MADLKSLYEQRARAWEEMKELITKDDWSGEDKEKYERCEADVDRLTGDIELIERHNSLKDKLDRNDPLPPTVADRGAGNAPDSAEQYREAFGTYLKRGMAMLPAEQRQILQTGLVTPEELRAQGVATNSAGGYTVTPLYRDKLIETMLFFGGMRQVSDVITTDTGADLPWPTNDDTSNEGAILAENTAMTEQDVTFGTALIRAYMFTSKITRVSLQFLQDSSLDVETWLPKKHGERIGRAQNRYFTVGTGTNEPEGVVTGSSIGKTGATGQTLSVTLADLIDLEHSIDIAYRNERATYMFHDLTLAKLRKLLDTTGRPLWQPSLQEGVPDQINGHRYVVNNHMPQMAANAKSILYGDFKEGYVIRDVRDVYAVRLDERYAEYLQAGFFSIARADGKVQNANAIKAYANSAT